MTMLNACIERIAARRHKVGLGVLGLALGMGLFAAAANAAPSDHAYLWADQASTASYTPNLTYQRNSSGATNTMVRTGVGVYQAHLPNLGALAGVVHVTAYGSVPHTCKVASWGPSGSTPDVDVRCFDALGAPVDTPYTSPTTPSAPATCK